MEDTGEWYAGLAQGGTKKTDRRAVNRFDDLAVSVLVILTENRGKTKTDEKLTRSLSPFIIR